MKYGKIYVEGFYIVVILLDLEYCAGLELKV